MIKLTKLPIFSFKNLALKLFLKSVFLFSIGIYVLSVPFIIIKFNIIDGINIYGYTSSPYIMLGECVFCVFLSIISILYSIITANKLRRLGKNESK